MTRRRTTRGCTPACRRRRSRIPASRRSMQPRIPRRSTTCTSCGNRITSITSSRPATPRSRTTPTRMAISARTRLVTLLGHPVAHSLSPRMQNAAFAARGLDWAYVALDVPPERLAEAVRGLASAGFVGANVTAPHKLTAARLCDEADAESVNTLVFEDARILGTSTDAAALEGLSLGRVSIVGDGGAARAFLAAVPGARVFSRRGDWPPDVSDADLVV